MNSFYAQLAASLPDAHPLKQQISSSMSDPQAEMAAMLAPNPPAPQPPPLDGGMSRAPASPMDGGMSQMPAAPSSPAAPPSAALDGGMSVQPVPASTAGPMSVQPPPGAPPHAPPGAGAMPMGPQIMRTPGRAAHEMAVEGPTQARLHAGAFDVQRMGAESLRDQSKTMALNDAIAASVRRDDAAQRMADAEAGRQKYLDDARRLEQDIGRDVQALAKGPEPVVQGGGEKALAGIAVALGAFGAGLTGGQNYAMQIVRGKMDDAIAQKRAEWEAKRTQVGAKQTAFDNLVRQYGMSGAEEMWRSAMAQKIASEAEEYAASRGIPAADAAYTKTLSDLGAMQLEHQAGAIKYVQAQGGGMQVFDPEIGVPVGVKEYGKYRMGRAADEGKIAATAEAKGADDRSNLFVATGAGGEGFLARTEKEAIAGRGLIQAKEEIIPMLRQLKDLRSEIGLGSKLVGKVGIDTEAVQRLQALASDAILQARALSASSPGALDEGLLNNMNSQLGDPQRVTELFRTEGAFGKVIDDMIGRIEKRADALTASGAQMARQQVARDRFGNVTTRPQGTYETGSPTPSMPQTFTPIGGR